MSAFFPGTNSY